jgi:predicted enzyme related to lactoylglutathione lyase
MKRMHVHICVDDLQTAIGFYSTLFAADPSVLKADYAKWMLERAGHFQWNVSGLVP